jgi:hypothetical protein
MIQLRRRMIENMTVRNLSPAAQRSYVHVVAKFARFFGRSPDKLDLDDVRAFQVHLVAGGILWPALNQIVSTLRLLYGGRSDSRICRHRNRALTTHDVKPVSISLLHTCIHEIAQR